MINSPPNQSPISDDGINIGAQWKQFFSDIFGICRDVQTSGITANRPVKQMYIGRYYFDTTIGLPIWWNGTIWVKADGSAA